MRMSERGRNILVLSLGMISCLIIIFSISSLLWHNSGGISLHIKSMYSESEYHNLLKFLSTADVIEYDITTVGGDYPLLVDYTAVVAKGGIDAALSMGVPITEGVISSKTHYDKSLTNVTAWAFIPMMLIPLLLIIIEVDYGY